MNLKFRFGLGEATSWLTPAAPLEAEACGPASRPGRPVEKDTKG